MWWTVVRLGLAGNASTPQMSQLWDDVVGPSPEAERGGAMSKGRAMRRGC